MKCKHQFIKIGDFNEEEKYGFGIEVITRGVEIICALCAERRAVCFDGEILIYNQRNELWEALA